MNKQTHIRYRYIWVGNSGQSLPGLLIVIAIFGILAGISFPSLNQSTGLTLRWKINNILKELETLQQLAVTSGQAIETRFYPGSYSTTTASGKKHTSTLHQGLIISESRFGNRGKQTNFVTFRPDGTVSPGHIVISTLNNKTCTLLLGIRGGMRFKCNPY